MVILLKKHSKKIFQRTIKKYRMKTLKYLLLVISIFCVNTTFAQYQIYEMTPYERVQYFTGNPDSWWDYNSSRHLWSNYTSGSYEYFYKYFLDNDGDGYGDPNNYIILTNDDQITENETPKVVYDEYSNSYTILIREKSFFYDGKTWVRKSKGTSEIYLDCNDNNTNLPNGFKVYYYDRDGDGYGSQDLPIQVRTTGCNIDLSGLATNNDDCDDLNDNVQNDPSNWYLDEDGDGYGTHQDVILSCGNPGGYSLLDGDCDDSDPLYNVEDFVWYPDPDNDGFGDYDNPIVQPCPPIGNINYIRDCYFDACPDQEGYDATGCPINDKLDYDENFIYEKVYKREFKKDELDQTQNNDLLKGITYIDGAGRFDQSIAIGVSPQNNDIVKFDLYNGNGNKNRSYLNYPTQTSNDGSKINDPLQEQRNFYNTNYGTTSAFSEKKLEDSPLNRILKQGAPGDDWQIGPGSDPGDHSMKYDYQTNNALEVMRFGVEFTNPPSTTDHQLKYLGTYQPGSLIKSIVKDENWQPNQINPEENTTVQFENKKGQTILERKFNTKLLEDGNDSFINEVIDTYYVYDDYGNLSYVLSPKATKTIKDMQCPGCKSGTLSINWTDVVKVDKELADEYQRKLMDYEDETLVNADLLNEYGGQGGIFLDVINDNLQLDVNITTLEPMRLRSRALINLSSLGRFKDTEVGRITGAAYSYLFYIRDNQLYVKGEGETTQLVGSLNAANKVSYQKNIPWYQFVELPERERSNLKNLYEDVPEEDKLSTYINNEYGASGGINLTIDEQDNINFNVNISSNVPLEFETGVLTHLDLRRRLSSRVLLDIVHSNLEASFRLIDNSLVIESSGFFTSITESQLTLPSLSSSNTISSNILNGLVYIYYYDHQNNQVKKKIPGKQEEHMVYDQLNRPVLTQDGEMRQENKWLFTKYDFYDRPVYTGIVEDDRDREVIQAELYDDNNGYALYEQKVDDSGVLSNGGLDIYYSNNAFPDVANSDDILTVKYYDDYEFDKRGISLASTTTTNVTIPTNENLPYDNEEQFTNNTKTLSTGSHIRVLGTDQWITNITLYDQKRRPIYTHTKNEFLGTEDIKNIELDFVGKTLQSRSKHIRGNSSTKIEDNFTYDHAQRLIKHTQKIDDEQAEELIVSNKYDELGQLIEKKVGGNDTQSSHEQTTALQAIAYDYNIRGWLTDINDVNNATTNKLFAFGIQYNDPENTNTTPLYNGNISETHWRTQNNTTITSDEKRSYAYEYDGMNRLNSADYLTNHNITLGGNNYQEDFNVGDITYDFNGNIETLTRNGLTSDNQIGIIDQLNYTPQSLSNKLSSVDDVADKNGFKDDGFSGTDYTYDLNGNMTEDKNKGIVNIEYNHLNLPKRIIFDEGNNHGSNEIRYTYDATGKKLSKEVITFTGTNGRMHSITNYENGFITKENKNYSYIETPDNDATDNEPSGYWIGNEIDLGIQFISHPEGYIEPDNQGNFDYIFQYKDHLGNIRLSYKDSNNDGSVDSSEIIEENNYYPFGLKHKGYNNVVNGSEYKYKTYNGKELEKGLGLNVIEMDFRQYNPALGRFNVIDLMAEKMFSETPYHFSLNNPVFFSDPSGLCPYGDCWEAHGHDRGDEVRDDNGQMWRLGEQGVWDRLGGDLEEVIVTASSKDGLWIADDWTTEMDQWGYSRSRSSWEEEYEMRAEDYTNEMGRDYMRRYRKSVKRERLKAFINRIKYINDIGAPEYALTYLKFATAGKLLSFSASSGVLTSIGEDAGLQFAITGDADLISSGFSAFTGRYKHIARFVGASADYSVKRSEFNTVIGNKSFNHMIYDWGASYAPSLTKNIASPGNYLGPNGVKLTGNAFGVLGSELLKNQ